MDKYIIKKDFNHFNIQKIKQFTEKEMEQLSNDKKLLCYQIGTDTTIIGSSKIVKLNDNCWKVSKNKNHILDFSSRKNSILYCIAIHKRQYKLAETIKSMDFQLGNLESKAQLCRYRYRTAVKNNNDWDAVLYSNRYSEIVAKIADIKHKLKKNTTVITYNVLQENHYH